MPALISLGWTRLRDTCSGAHRSSPPRLHERPYPESAFVILDEAQNTTPEQMKMFLTRLGMNSKAVVNGDITQIDLPKGVYSGLDQSGLYWRASQV